MHTFPDVLLICPRRTYYDVSTYSAKKLDVYIDVAEEDREAMHLETFRGRGPQPGESLMRPRTPPPHKPPRNRRRHDGAPDPEQEQPVLVVDELALATVISMGIGESVARHALQQTNMDVERAVDYIFSHPDLETRVVVDAANSGQDGGVVEDAEAESGQERREEEEERRRSGEESATHVTGEVEDEAAAAASLAVPHTATDGLPRYRLVSMISHMGASVKTGHYVCHIRDKETNRWLLFNDEKVGFSQDTPFAMAYIYFFARM